MSQMNKSNPTREYVNDVLDTTVDDGTLPPQLRDLLVNDFPLANLNGADRQYFRLYSENVGLMTDEAYPPQESYAQGSIGSACYGDPDYNAHARDTITSIKTETALLDHFARTSRAVNGWRQDKFSESIQTSRVEDNRSDEGEEKRGLARLLG